MSEQTQYRETRSVASILDELGLDPTDDNGSRPTNALMGGATETSVRASRSGRAIVVGAGVTGLATAWQLAAAGKQVLILEATCRAGGMATTFRYKDFLLDQGPHKFFSTMEDRMRMVEEIMGADFLTVPKRSRIRLTGHLLDYPVGLVDLVKNLSPLIAVSGGASYVWQLIRNLFDRTPDLSYEDWLVRRFGWRLYDLVFAAYARKIWGEPKTLARELAETRIAVPGLLPLLFRMLFAPRRGPVIHAETFRFPQMGSGEFCRRLAELVIQYGGQIQFGTPVTRVVQEHNRVSALNIGTGGSIPVGPEDVVILTIPIGYLVRSLEPVPPSPVLQAVNGLRARDLVLLYVILDQPSVSDDNWLFFPESQYIFTRVSEQKNFSAMMCPADKTSLCLEIVADEASWRASDAELYERAIAGLEETGLVNRSRVLEYFTRRLKWVYPVYDIHYRQNAHTALDYLDSISNLYSVGRQGGFNYVGQIDCLDIGVVTAEHILRQKGKDGWPAARQRFEQYTVLD